ncbi:hypothetical protein SAMN05444858_11623 [Micromonospora avicenniae]|uniref:Uncharacterized protein n=1 Tax=Micromonospora avicenniae TaxID=1198245 RepID=A0A1N7DCG5_9ACTN|nr:hypothetical protein SAMN05444858_11623 [Micromonospora avicenniae]
MWILAFGRATPHRVVEQAKRGRRMGTPYTPAARFRRTQAERVDQVLSWQRTDQAFFAAGACHVLAWVAAEQYAAAGFGITGLRQHFEPYVSHVIISNGRWAFDHDGWTPLPELLRATAEYEPEPSWELLPITSTLQDFCAAQHHRLPEQYAHDPLPRARRYLKQRPRPPEAV